jgi:hypothetical protein
MIDGRITTENMEQSHEHRGTISILRVYRAEGSHLTFCDIEITTDVRLPATVLNRVDYGKLRWLVNNAERHTEIISREESRRRVTEAQR